MQGFKKFQSTFPLQGTTAVLGAKTIEEYEFQSTFPLQGTTHADNEEQWTQIISIHVPIAGNDYPIIFHYDV